MPNAMIATRIATTSETTPAIQALRRRTPSRTNRVTRGIAATSADRPRLPPTGSRTCSNTVTSTMRTHPTLVVGKRSETTGRRSSARAERGHGKATDRGIEHLDRVGHADVGALPLQRRADLHQAAGIGRDQQRRLGLGDVAGLAVAELAGGLGVQDVPDAGRAAAQLGLGDLAQLQAGDAAQQLARLRP